MKHQIGELGGRVHTLLSCQTAEGLGVRIPLKMGDCDLSLQTEAESVIIFLQLTLPKMCI